jgi:hypothetical protein
MGYANGFSRTGGVAKWAMPAPFWGWAEVLGPIGPNDLGFRCLYRCATSIFLSIGYDDYIILVSGWCWYIVDHELGREVGRCALVLSHRRTAMMIIMLGLFGYFFFFHRLSYLIFFRTNYTLDVYAGVDMDNLNKVKLIINLKQWSFLFYSSKRQPVLNILLRTSDLF